MAGKWSPVFKARDPRNPDRGQWTVGVAPAHFQKLRVAGDEARLARLILVREVLEGGTTHLYEGWCRPDMDDDCFVYVGRPQRDFRSLSIETPSPKGHAFLVFILRGGTTDLWTWRPCPVGQEQSILGSGAKLVWELKKT
jgi:hypothetical protein